VHLNPVRAGMLPAEERLESYRWSSYPAYLSARQRPAWLRVDRLLGEHALEDDSAANRRAFSRHIEQLRLDAQGPATETLRTGWKLGAEDFAEWLSQKLNRPGAKGERARERTETDEALAQRMVREALCRAGWSEDDLRGAAKGHWVKVQLARELREYTPMTGAWIAARLKMGSPSYLSALLASVESKL